MFLQLMTMDYAEVPIDRKYHRHIIGKGGANSESHTMYLYGSLGPLSPPLFSPPLISPPHPSTPLTVNKIKSETGTSIHIPSDGEPSDAIRIEGDPKGVAAAKAAILDLAKKIVREYAHMQCHTHPQTHNTCARAHHANAYIHTHCCYFWDSLLTVPHQNRPGPVQ